MFIAFEGPDNVGKSTSANNLAHDGVAIYQGTKELHAVMQEATKDQQDLVVTYDRIDWFSHMIYRLSLPEHEWNDARNRTVFAMPDTHLVVKTHRPDLAVLISDELYTDGKVAEVNPMYYYHADFLLKLNRFREYALFKSVTIMEVANDPRDGTFTQRMIAHDSAAGNHQIESIAASRGMYINSDEALLEHLRWVDQNVG